jgi:quercetin 2,3-dioxygenase
VRVFVGDLAGGHSPVHAYSPLLEAQVDLAAGARVVLDIDSELEHGLLCDLGAIETGCVRLNVGELG